MTRKPIRLSTAFCLGLLIGAPLASPVRAQDNAQPVKIGVLTDMAGMYKDIMGPGSVLAAQMATTRPSRTSVPRSRATGSIIMA